MLTTIYDSVKNNLFEYRFSAMTERNKHNNIFTELNYFTLNLNIFLVSSSLADLRQYKPWFASLSSYFLNIF